MSFGRFEMFKILGSDFGTVGIRRRKQVCADKFLAMVTEDVVAFLLSQDWHLSGSEILSS